MQDFSKRIAVVIDKGLPAWQAMNTLAHISAYYGKLLGNNFDTGEFFTASDKLSIPRNCQYPIIIFQTDHDKLQEIARSAKSYQDVQTMHFIKEMIETSVDDEIVTALSTKPFNELDFLGVGIFGDNAIVKAYTKQFKLWS
jgi:hypothetical protein